MTPACTAPHPSHPTAMRSLQMAALSLLVIASASAQPTGSPEIETVYARPGYPTVVVYVMGQVTSPGKWRVEQAMPLLDLLAAVRPEGVGLVRSGVDQELTVRLYRAGRDGARTLVLEQPVEPLLLDARAATPLQEGDLLQVDARLEERPRRPTVFEWAGVVSTVASVAALIASLLR